MLAYFYPPITAVGKNRTIRFANQLPNFGYQPIVHTVKNPDRRLVPVAEKQESDLEHVHRSWSFNLGLPLQVANWTVGKLGRILGKDVQRNPVRRLLVPDAHLGWMPGCILKSWRLIRREKPSAIYATCSPFSRRFKRRNPEEAYWSALSN